MANGFGNFVPGFDFLQGLSKQSGNEMHNSPQQASHFGHWVTPTFNLEELEKRITDLKTVQFWLDQNALALKTTIQALEVQKMTLVTLKGMNLNMADIANGLKTDKEANSSGANSLIDPTAWWGALTQQFQQMAMNTVQESSKEGAPNPAPKVAAKRGRKTPTGAAQAGQTTPAQATKMDTKAPRKAPIRKRS